MPFLILLALLAAIYYVWVIRPRQKMEQIRRSPILQMLQNSRRYGDLPLSDLGIVHKIQGNQRIQLILPTLTEAGEVDYIYAFTPGLISARLRFPGNLLPARTAR